MILRSCFVDRILRLIGSGALATLLLVAGSHIACAGSDDPVADMGPPDVGSPPVDAGVDSLLADTQPHTPDAGPVEPTTWPQTTSADRKRILELMKTEKAPGLAACLIKNGKLIWCDGFGFADITRKVPVTRDTPFMLASVTKTVTAVAVLQLRDKKSYTLDDDVSKLLPFKVVHPASTAPITLRHLLRHTSGINDNWTMMNKLYGYPTKPGGGATPPMTLAAAMKGYFTKGGALYAADNWLTVGPGIKWTYSNIAVALAAYVAEVVSKQEYADLYEKNIFAPLGMKNTAFRWADLGGVEVALPYTWTASGGYSTKGHYTFTDAPNGALRASARDMARFLAAVMRGGELGGVRILKASTVAEMIKVQDPKLHSRWGLSWATRYLLGKFWVGHNGEETGVAADMAFHPADKVGYIILRNFNPSSTGNKQIRAQITGMVGTYAK